MRIKDYNIIFDLDGTLVHSVPDMHNAINKTLTEYNLEFYIRIKSYKLL